MNLAQLLATLPVHHDTILISPHARLTEDGRGATAILSSLGIAG